MKIALLLLARLGSLVRAACPLLAGLATLLLCCWLSGCAPQETAPGVVLDRSGTVVASLPAGDVLRVVVVNAADDLRYVRVATGIVFEGDARAHCPEATALLMVAAYANDEEAPLSGAPVEAAASHAGERCPALRLAAPAGSVLVVEVEGLAGREQPGRDVAVSVQFE